MDIARICAKRDFDIVSCRPDTTVADAIDLLCEHRIGAMPVIDSMGAICGIFSERDVIRCLRELGGSALDELVERAMTAPPVTAAPNTGVDEALALMTRRRFRHLPIIEDGRMIDFVSIGDLVKSRIDEIETEAAALRSYIRSA